MQHFPPQTDPSRLYPNDRKFVIARDNSTCQYCETELAEDKVTLDHVVPRGEGGGHERENLVCACGKCNQNKGPLTLAAWRDEMLERRETAQTPAARLYFSTVIGNIESRFSHELQRSAPHLMNVIARPRGGWQGSSYSK